MHYKNGRPAQNGDKVVYFGWGGPVVGILYDATPGNDSCNGKLAPIAPNDPCPNLAECLHLDDVLGVLPHVEGKPAPGVTYGAPSVFLDLGSVPKAE